jgi:hypothetical protein
VPAENLLNQNLTSNRGAESSSQGSRLTRECEGPQLLFCVQIFRVGALVIDGRGALVPAPDQIGWVIGFVRLSNVNSDVANHRPQGRRSPFFGWAGGPGEAQDSLFSRTDGSVFGGNSARKTRGRGANGAR